MERKQEAVILPKITALTCVNGCPKLTSPILPKITVIIK